ncbi:DNA-binding transcriptional regulator [Parelusimicrobium proximum]|uniref:TetR/AcrR family transcriptional regulator n=1 Tax=Parelusimicrobium proximum TaxID=3228953 RepID=UPI003D164005
MTKEKTKEQKMRERIIHKAFNLMSKKGIEQVSMREIADSLKVSKPVLYYYFKDKEDLCKQIIDKHITGYIEHLLSETNKNLTIEEYLEKSIIISKEAFVSQDKKLLTFMAHVTSYALKEMGKCRNSGKLFKEKKAESKEIMKKTFKEYELKNSIPKGSAGDLLQLSSAIIAHFIMNSTFNNELDTDQGFPKRISQIMALGVREYYKKEGKNK